MLPFIEIFGEHISTYSLCIVTGLIFSGMLLYFTTRKRRDFSYIQIINIPMFAITGAFLGAKTLFFITRLELFLKAESWKNFGEIVSEACGGMVFYGGLVGAILMSYLYSRLAKIDFWLYADIFAPAIPLFHSFGRIGCFMAGCCYGIENGWGFVYHNEYLDPSVNGVTRLPIQLIEAGLNILIMIVLVYCDQKRLKKGSLLGIYFIIYPTVRFFDEFFRGDEIRGHLLFLSTSQWISIIIFIIGVIILSKRYVFEKDKYDRRLKTGNVPEGYIYNRYAGAVPPEEQYKLKNP